MLLYLQTPLHLAVLTGNADSARILISFGAQPSVTDSSGNTALHLAVLHGNLDCLKAILNTDSTESLSLDDFNDEGKRMFGLY
jgi:ankyrin repeat protein